MAKYVRIRTTTIPRRIRVADCVPGQVYTFHFGLSLCQKCGKTLFDENVVLVATGEKRVVSELGGRTCYRFLYPRGKSSICDCKTPDTWVWNMGMPADRNAHVAQLALTDKE